MVDFSKLKKGVSSRPVEPQQLFHSLMRQPEVQYLRDVQKDVLDAWFLRREKERDFIVKMNTGAGKTLVGLLALQSGLNEGLGPALYLCPTHQLVSQVVSHAASYGIETVLAEGSLPPEFLNGKSILVTTFQTFFNGLSRFGVVGGRHSEIQLGSLLLDDAHSCVARAREAVTLSFDRDHPAYEKLVSLFQSSLEEQSRPVATEIINGSTYATLVVPHWTWMKSIAEVSTIIGAHSHENSVKFAWPLILDSLELSQCVVSADSVEIFPLAVPVHRLPSFVNAKRRFFLSATLVDDSLLVRDLGVDAAAARSPIVPKIIGDVGQRLILVPHLLSNDLTRDSVIDLIKTWVGKGFNTVVLVPSKKLAEEWKKVGAQFPSGDEEVQAALAALSTETGKFVVLANRYDGVDLPGNSCRILVLDGLPVGGLKYEQHLMNTRPGSRTLFGSQAQRVEQGLGRGVRGGNDFCGIFILGSELTTFVATNANQALFSPATRTQVQIGLDLVEAMKADNDPITAMDGALRDCLDQTPSWKEFHHERMSDLSSILSPSSTNIELAELERRAFTMFASNQPIEASDLIRQSLGSRTDVGDADVGWYLQLAAHLRSVDVTVAQEIQRAAHKKNQRLTKPLGGAIYQKMSTARGMQVQRILQQLKTYVRPNALISAADEILTCASFSVRAHVFEDAWQRLGTFLGFGSQRPESEYQAGPDNLWDLDGELYLPTEAKNEVLSDREFIFKTEASQLSNSVNWFEKEYPGKQFVPVLIHPSTMLAGDAFIDPRAKVLSVSGLSQLAKAVHSLAVSLSQRPSDSWTPDDVSKLLGSLNLTPAKLLPAYFVSPVKKK